MEENTMEIMTNEEVIETENTYGEVAEIEEPVEDLDEGLETESDSMANVGIAVAGVALVAAAGYGLTKLGKKIWKTKPVKNLRGKLGKALTKGLEEEDAPATVLPIEVVDETAAENADQEE